MKKVTTRSLLGGKKLWERKQKCKNGEKKCVSGIAEWAGDVGTFGSKIMGAQLVV